MLTRSPAWQRGAFSALGGYGSLVLGAAAGAVFLRQTGTPLFTGVQSFHSSETLVQYWRSFTVPSVSVSVVCGVAGTMLIISHRSVLTAGVMIGLALVPTAALAGMALTQADWALVGQAGLRFLVEAGLVLVTALIVFAGKRRQGRRARMWL